MTKARELAELGTTLSVDGSGNADLAGILTTDGLTVSTSSAVTASFARDGSDGDVVQIYNGAAGTTKALGLGVSGTHGTINSQYGGVYIQPSGTTSAFFGTGGDISFYEDTGTTAKLFWDASAESLGIGTTSPWANLSLPFGAGLSFGSSTYPLTISRSASGQLITTIADGYDSSSARIDFVMRNGHPAQNTALSIAGSGNVGIGTSSPSEKLHLYDTTGSISINEVAAGGGGVASWRLKHGTSHWGAYVGTTDNLIFYDYGASSERLRITSTGNVGIGTSSPGHTLDVTGAAGTFAGLRVNASSFQNTGLIANRVNNGNTAALYFTESGANQAYIISYGSAYGSGLNSALQIVNGSNALTFDASGNLLVGTTDTLAYNPGARINQQSLVVTNTSATATDYIGYFNRQSSDGTILQFGKANSTVGSISTVANNIAIGRDDTALYISATTDSITPTTIASGTPVERDGGIDLGRSSARFKDLYLSGGVYLGGTGAANLLDDYEEGAWTPRIADYITGSTLVSAGSYSGTYTKIGNAVVLRAVIGATASLSSGTLAIWDLPFVVANNQSAYAPGACLTRQVNLSGGSYIIMEPTKGAAKCIPLIAFSGTTATTSLVTSAMCGSQITLNFTITYLTD